ncbi:MAG: hypothetical protein N2508_11035 [Anaerolineae bacterium]|nr:hypothetical protein [Anaerolineae bacterium]
MTGIGGIAKPTQAAGLALALVGYFGVWIPHKAAALAITGVELAEWARFLPQPEKREWLYLPLAVVLVLLAVQAGRSSRLSIRLGTPLLLAALLLTLLLPYVVVDSLRHSLSARTPPAIVPEYRGQLALLIAAVVLVLMAPWSSRLPDRVRGAASALLALIGVVPPLWRFAPLRAHIAAVYGSRTLPLGWGTIVCTLGFVLFIAGVMAEVKASGE